MRPIQRIHFQVLYGSVIVLLAALRIARGEINTDGSIGAQGPIVPVAGRYSILDSRGAQVGGNLFHSFGAFNLANGETAAFSGPANVRNILARVTDGSASTIDGTISSDITGANLFLMNPAGFIFKSNAKIDLKGSFAVTTAHYLAFSDGTHFDANRIAAPVLTAADVSAFGFASPPKSVLIDKSAFELFDRSTFSIVAGTINIRGNESSTNPSQIVGMGVNFNLMSVGSSGEARLPAPGDAGSVRGFSQLGDIVLSSKARIRTRGENAGRVVIRGGSLTVVEQSSITSQVTGGTDGRAFDVHVRRGVTLTAGSALLTKTSGSNAAGDFSLRADTLGLSLSSNIGSQARGVATASARAGAIRVQAADISIESGSVISGSTFGLASGNAVDVRANTILIRGELTPAATGIFANTISTGSGGAGGSVRVVADTLRIKNAGSISADTSGLGAGGDVEIHARDIAIAAHAQSAEPHKTGVFADSLSTMAGGKGGDVSITADRLRITDGGLISTKTLGFGRGGDTKIQVGKLRISRGESPIFTGIAVDTPFGAGAGGNASVVAGKIRIDDRGQISANTGTFHLDGAGRVGAGGSVRVQAGDIAITGRADEQFTGISAESLFSGDGGPGGNVEVIADRLRLLDGGGISANTNGAGASGNVLVSARDALLSNPGTNRFTAISAETKSHDDAGAGGSIRAEFGALTIIGGGTIAANTAGPGAAGNIAVVVDTARLIAGGRISADSRSTGPGGSIEVRARDLFVSSADALRQSGIFSRSLSRGAGGSIDVVAENLRLTSAGGVVATARSRGDGGSVTVRVDQLALDTMGAITASTTARGAGGSVDVTAGTLSIDGAAGRTGIFADTSAARNGGNGGTIRVAADSLSVASAGRISASTSGSGRGGGIVLGAGKVGLRDGAAITTSATGAGSAGDILLTVSGPVNLTNGSSLANTALISDAGLIELNSLGPVTLSLSAITVQATARNAGRIAVRTPGALTLQNSGIVAAAGGTGGNIEIAAGFLDLQSSLISANAVAGDGGSIALFILASGVFGDSRDFVVVSDFVRQSSDSRISASSEQGLQGILVIAAPQVDLSGSLAELKTDLLNTSVRLQDRCAMGLGSGVSTFLVVGRGGVSLVPDDPLPSVR